MRYGRQRESNKLHCPVWIGLGILILLAPAIAGAQGATRNQRLVNENQHRTEQAPTNWSCTGTPPSQEGVAPPLSSLGADTLLGAHSYHVGTGRNVAEAKCYYNAYNRPKILSSDIGGVLPATAKNWMLNIQSNHYLGQIHFEHYDACLAAWATQGHAISDDTTFPDIDYCERPLIQGGAGLGTNYDDAPAEVLGWFKTDLGSNLTNARLRQNGLLYRPYTGSAPNDERRNPDGWATSMAAAPSRTCRSG